MKTKIKEAFEIARKNQHEMSGLIKHGRTLTSHCKDTKCGAKIFVEHQQVFGSALSHPHKNYSGY